MKNPVFTGAAVAIITLLLRVLVPMIPITAVHWQKNLLPAVPMPCCW